MKLSAVLSITALLSGSASAVPVDSNVLETSALQSRATRVPIKGIICNPPNIPGASQWEYGQVMARLNDLGLDKHQDIAPKTCPKRIGYNNAAFHTCNDNSYVQPIGNRDIQEMVIEIYKKCAPTGDRYSGQAFTTHGWNVIIRAIH